jgi:DNA-binding MarR family transcriptional regulator
VGSNCLTIQGNPRLVPIMKCIGIDDACRLAYQADVSSVERPAQRFMQLFSETYSLLHRRNHPQQIPVTPEGRGLLLHLAWSGPLAIGELALHTKRAQSVVSESVAVLESHALLARVRDPRDRRRTLVWLTERARQWLAEEREPLDSQRTKAVLDSMTPTERRQLLEAFAHFIAIAQRMREHGAGNTSDQTSTHQPTKRRKGSSAV